MSPPATLGRASGSLGSVVIPCLDLVRNPNHIGSYYDLVTARADRSAPLTWIQIGSVAGLDAAIPSATLRSARLQLVGSGVGSVPGRDFIEELPKLAAAVADGAFDVSARAVSLADVEEVWTTTAGTRDRIVLVP